MNLYQSLALRFLVAALSLVVFLALSAPSEAASPATAVVDEAGGHTFNIVMAAPLGSTSRAGELQRAISANFAILPLTVEMNPQGIPGGAQVSSAKAEGIDFSRFALAKADHLITTNWLDSSNVEIRCFDVSEGRFLFGNTYPVARGEEGLRDTADKFCADYLEKVIGNGSFFRSNLAFIRSDGQRKKDVWVMKPNGRQLRKVTNMPGEALSPAWSRDGRFVIFTHIDSRSHALGVWDGNSRSVQRITFPGNTVIGPTFMPDNRVAVSLTDGRNPSIFLLNHAFQRERKLDNSTAIDVSPSVDSMGNRMVFTSNRFGNPHIFMKDLRTGAVSRITTEGKYNTDPGISPDGSVVVFARQVPGGHRIFAKDLVTNQERQISFGPGSDEQPEFAPDGYFVTFMSTRSGQKEIYVVSRYGGVAKRLPTGQGDASFPAWGPSR